MSSGGLKKIAAFLPLLVVVTGGVLLCVMDFLAVAPVDAGGLKTGVPVDTGAAQRSPAAVSAADWASRTVTVMIKAEQAVALEGKMNLATGPDNEGVVDEAGEPARVSYVWVEDFACKAEPAKAAESHAAFDLEVKESGVYYPWARVWWTDDCGNSLTVLIGAEGGEADDYLVTSGTSETWHWLKVAGKSGVKLDTGMHRIVVENKEDGARLSRILLTTADYDRFVPQGPDGR